MLRVLTTLLIVLAVLGLGFGIAGAIYQPNTEIPPGFEGKHLMVEGVPPRVLQRGGGRGVLLLHGSPGSLEDWSPIVDALSPDYRLTVYDRPGVRRLDRVSACASGSAKRGRIRGGG